MPDEMFLNNIDIIGGYNVLYRNRGAILSKKTSKNCEINYIILTETTYEL